MACLIARPIPAEAVNLRFHGAFDAGRRVSPRTLFSTNSPDRFAPINGSPPGFGWRLFLGRPVAACSRRGAGDLNVAGSIRLQIRTQPAGARASHPRPRPRRDRAGAPFVAIRQAGNIADAVLQRLYLFLFQLLDPGQLVAGTAGGVEQFVELGVEGDVAAMGVGLALLLTVENALVSGGEDRRLLEMSPAWRARKAAQIG